MKPFYSRRAMEAFELAFGPWRRRRLHTAPIAGLPSTVPADRPLLLVANHTSWWDGFLLRDVHRMMRPEAPLHTLMSASELARLPLFRLIGAMPVEKGPGVGALRLIRALQRLRDADSSMTVTIFPRGEIAPAWLRPLGFRRGVELISQALAPCVVLPVAVHLEPLNHAAPTALIAAGPLLHVRADELGTGAVEQLVTRRLDDIAALLTRHGERAPAHMEELS